MEENNNIESIRSNSSWINTTMRRKLYDRYDKICDVLILSPQSTRKLQNLSTQTRSKYNNSSRPVFSASCCIGDKQFACWQIHLLTFNVVYITSNFKFVPASEEGYFVISPTKTNLYLECPYSGINATSNWFCVRFTLLPIVNSGIIKFIHLFIHYAVVLATGP